jgi:hypothetical protein
LVIFRFTEFERQALLDPFLGNRSKNSALMLRRHASETSDRSGGYGEAVFLVPLAPAADQKVQLLLE